MSSNSISSDSKELEKALLDLEPAALDFDFLSRLEEAAEGNLVALSAAEIHFEKSLRGRAPAPLSTDFMARLEGVVSDIQFAVDEKILMFPKTAPVSARPAARKRSMWAAAAAVALIGASTALLLPGTKPAASAVAKNASSSIATPFSSSARDSHYVAAGFNRGLGDAIDEGVSWDQADKPHRVVRVTYLDRVLLKNAEGKMVEVEQPRTEYILVPEKMD